MSHTTVDLLGVRIDALRMKEAADIICDRAKSTEAPVYVTKPYVEFLDRAASESELTELLNGSFLSLPDSIAVQWGGWYMAHGKPGVASLLSSLMRIISRPHSLARPIPERFAGADFAWKMLEAAQAGKLSIYLIGHPKGSSIEHTATTIANRLPQLKIVGMFDGYAANNLEAQLIEDLRLKRPDLILVGIGFPRQERLMSRLVTKLDHGLLIGEGGTFDYESFGGRIRRAPSWMRRIGLEWLWRLVLQPSRIKRQLAIPRFIMKLYRAKNHN